MGLTFRGLLCSSLAFSLCLMIGCRSLRSNEGSTRLCDGFQSYESAREIRQKLVQAGVMGQWRERVQAVKPPDRRPPYEMLTLSGPFTLSGIDGYLELTIYNDRLMEAQFSTRRGREYLAKLREENVDIPAAPQKEIEIDRRTTFEYFTDSDSTIRFLWTDPKLEEEWNAWVARFA